MKILIKLVLLSILYASLSLSQTFGSEPTEKELRGLQALEEIQFTITSLAETSDTNGREYHSDTRNYLV